MGGGEKQTQFTQQSSGPWKPQQPYILDAFQRAQDAYNANTSQGAYTGDYVAAPSQAQYGAYGNATAQGYNQQGANNGILNQGVANSALGSAGALSAMAGMGNFANSNLTASNIDAAKRYADGMDIPGLVKAGMFEANRNASENTIPSLYRSAAASGNINSDRTALAQGVVERGLAEQSQNLGSQLYNQAYTTGLSNAQQANAQQLQALSQQGSLGSGILNAGVNGVNSGISNQASLNQQITGGANGQNQLDQQTLNNDIQKYLSGQNFNWEQLRNLMAIVGGNFGSESSGVSQTEKKASGLSTFGSILGAVGKLI